jgi:hypothetical protein
MQRCEFALGYAGVGRSGSGGAAAARSKGGEVRLPAVEVGWSQGLSSTGTESLRQICTSADVLIV